MTTIYALSVINKMREEWYRPPKEYQYGFRFEYDSYKHSAISEICMYLMEHELEDPIEALETFRCEMDNFACNAKTTSTNFMFSVYYDIATDVLDVLLSPYNVFEEGVDYVVD